VDGKRRGSREEWKWIGSPLTHMESLLKFMDYIRSLPRVSKKFIETIYMFTELSYSKLLAI
jgi:hypothetical protein